MNVLRNLLILGSAIFVLIGCGNDDQEIATLEEAKTIVSEKTNELETKLKKMGEDINALQQEYSDTSVASSTASGEEKVNLDNKVSDLTEKINETATIDIKILEATTKKAPLEKEYETIIQSLATASEEEKVNLETKALDLARKIIEQLEIIEEASDEIIEILST